MEDTINKIIQIEEDAKRIVADAKKKKDTLSEDVDAAVKAMRRITRKSRLTGFVHSIRTRRALWRKPTKSRKMHG